MQDKLKFPVYPVFVGAVPALAVYSANIALLPLSQLWVPLLVGVGITTLLTLAVYPIFRNWDRAAILSSVLFIAFCGFANATTPLIGVEGPAPVYVFYGVAVAVAGFCAVRFIRPSVFPNLFFFLLVAILSGNTVGKILLQHQFRQTFAHSNPVKPLVNLPDIYYIILDGYGRSDVFREKYGFDDSPFVTGLKDSGFYVAADARSNYCQTEISLASSLNFDHIPTLLPAISPTDNSRQPLDELIRHSHIQAELKSLGYESIAITTGFPPIDFPESEQNFRVIGGLNLLESSIIQLTPLGKVDGVMASLFVKRKTWILEAFQSLTLMAGHSSRPRFVVVHILAPHPPFVFRADGTLSQRTQHFGYQDGSDYMEQGGTVADYVSGYSGQATFVGAKTLAAVRETLAKSKDAIVIVQGDHGPKAHLNQNDIKKTDLDECFPILNALHLPDSMKASLYPGITPVNTFRVVLNGLAGETLPMLPDGSFYSGFSQPYTFTDVTAKLRPRTPATSLQ